MAFIGPNGAGKSTTIKMLTGVLYPTNGNVQVMGFDPFRQKTEYLKNIGTVFGQRSQLLQNLPLIDSLEMTGYLYDLSKKEITKQIAKLNEILNLQNFLDQPVRKLSLGQRMRGEIACSKNDFYKPWKNCFRRTNKRITKKLFYQKTSQIKICRFS